VEPPPRVLLQTALDHLGHRRRNGDREWLGLAVEDGVSALHEGARREGPGATEHLVEDGPEAEEDRDGTLREAVAQRLALQELGDEIRLPVLETHVVEGHDIGVVQRTGQLRLALEPFEERAVGAQRLGHHLERHVPPEPGIPGSVHLGHSSTPEQGHHLVRADAGIEGETHRQQRTVAPTRRTSLGGSRE
jgi:hypothetical protein